METVIAASITGFSGGRDGQAITIVDDPQISYREVAHLQERLTEEPVHPPIVIITGHGDVPMAVRAMKSGAIDFIEKPFNDEVLLDAIRRAIAYGEQQRSHQTEHLQIQERLQHLTPREHEVMDMVTDGRSNKEIAVTLGVMAGYFKGWVDDVVQYLYTKE